MHLRGPQPLEFSRLHRHLSSRTRRDPQALDFVTLFGGSRGALAYLLLEYTQEQNANRSTNFLSDTHTRPAVCPHGTLAKEAEATS